MKKEDRDINSILLANWYLMNCQKDNREVARKYLTLQIKKALLVKSKNNTKEPVLF